MSWKRQHRPLSLSEGKVAVLDPVVGPAPDLLLLAIPERGRRCLVKTQSIGGDCSRRSVPLDRPLYEAKRSSLVACPGDVALQNLALVVDGSPEVDHLPFSFTYISLRCQRQWRMPRIALTRCRRTSPANIDPNRCHQWRTVS